MADTAHVPVILNIDDDEPGRYAVTRLLQHAGYHVAEAATGQQGLDLVARTSPDLVVLDVDLPDMSGYEVARQLRANPATAGIPILQLSATSIDQECIVRGLESGVDAYLCEPVSEPVLLAQVATLLRMRRLHQEVTAARAQAESQAERLRVTVEELQVSKEEAEVANEELQTAYDELAQRQAQLELRQTEQQRAEAALAESEALLTAVVASTDHLLAYLDSELRFVWANAALAHAVARPLEEIVGRAFPEVFTRDEDLRLAIEEVLATGEPVQFQSLPRRLGPGPGHQRYLAIYLAPVREAKGTVVGVVFSAHDLTSQVQQRRQLVAAERARAELAESLNKEIARRTKNNLAMAAGLIQLQAMQQRDPAVGAALSETMSRLMTFASVHEEMQTDGSGWVDLRPVLQRLGSASQGAFPGGGRGLGDR